MAPISRHEGRSDGHPVRRRGEFASGRGRGRGRVSITQGQGRGTHTFPGPTNGLEPHGTGQQPSRRRGLQTPRGRGDLAPRAGGSESHISGQGRGTRALSSRTLDRGTGRRGITEHRGRPSSRGRGQGHRPDDRISLEQYLATHPLDKVPIIQQASNSAKSSPQHSDSIAISPSARASSVNNNDTTIAKSSEQADRRISTTPPSTTPPPQSPGSRSELTPLDNAMARIKIKLPPNLTPQNTVTTREENIAGVVPAKEACNKIGNHSPTLPLASIPDLGKRDRAMELIDYDASDEHTATSTRERANEGKKETSVDDMLMGKVEEMRTLEYSIEKRERQVEPAVVERQWEQSSELPPLKRRFVTKIVVPDTAANPEKEQHPASGDPMQRSLTPAQSSTKPGLPRSHALTQTRKQTMTVSPTALSPSAQPLLPTNPSSKHTTQPLLLQKHRNPTAPAPSSRFINRGPGKNQMRRHGPAAAFHGMCHSAAAPPPTHQNPDTIPPMGDVGLQPRTPGLGTAVLSPLIHKPQTPSHTPSPPSQPTQNHHDRMKDTQLEKNKHGWMNRPGARRAKAWREKREKEQAEEKEMKKGECEEEGEPMDWEPEYL